MVNVTVSDARSRILAMLRDSSAPISGEFLGEGLGISRVAVHKHMKALREAGYAITSDHRGYGLEESHGRPFTSWEFSGEEHIIVLEETSSTMDEAHGRARRHPGEDFTLAAIRQTGGRGRRGRPWSSPDGGLWATRVIHPAGSALHMQLHVMAAAAALARTLTEHHGIDARLKWPNDILAGGRKIAGVLGEAAVSGDRISYLAIGLGLNVNNETDGNAAALKTLSGHEEDRRDLLRDWVRETDALLASRNFRPGRRPDWWNERMTDIGAEAAFTVRGKCRGGRIIGADGLGRLVLRSPSGRKIRIAAGDVDDEPRDRPAASPSGLIPAPL